MEKFFKRELQFSIILLLFTLFLFGIHWYIDYNFFDEVEYRLPLFSIYTFHFITVIIVFSLINFMYSKGKTQYLNLFLGATLVKMLLCIVFLLPIILKPTEYAKHEVINFFIPYFLFLGFEVFCIVNFLNQK